MKNFNVFFEEFNSGYSLRTAVSHLNNSGMRKGLFGLAQKGVLIEMLAHDTHRRVPLWVEQKMLQNDIVFNRYAHPRGLPMHNKFMIINTPKRKLVTFGSMNLSVRSLHANHELLVITESPFLYQTMERRWSEMLEVIKTWQKKQRRWSSRMSGLTQS